MKSRLDLPSPSHPDRRKLQCGRSVQGTKSALTFDARASAMSWVTCPEVLKPLLNASTHRPRNSWAAAGDVQSLRMKKSYLTAEVLTLQSMSRVRSSAEGGVE